MKERKPRAPAEGFNHRTPAVKRLSTSYDAETFAQVRELALKKRTSCAEQIRQLVECGLETLAEREQPDGRGN
jgi:hypothetical protein